ncbi:collagen-like protein [Maribellus comscasis]|uniref:Collagen-like protein n=1 Tax=Maribellus comscasis TaxID=2681766 RepID=A0A6I6JT22_9BACT|nr:collagen-like protein [Maribellus comscasis]QGY44379.1 collagen-like protein [Maribellus comscasis]
MKTIASLFLVLALIFTTSCEGPVGPPGTPGEDGMDAEIGTVFETDPINFTAGNEYSVLFQFPNNFTVYDGDAVLVYILWDVIDGKDVWRLLPQTVVIENDGVVQYNFDYTLDDVQIFLEWTTSELLPAETDNQIFRIAVLPAAFMQDKSFDIGNFDSVMKSMNKNLKSIEKIDSSIQMN